MNRTALAAIPLALGLATQVAQHTSLAPHVATTTTHRISRPANPAAERDFSISLGNLNAFASSVVATLSGVKIEGHSGVHQPDADCEMHFGAHAPIFQASPSGIVLEPMNACREPAPAGAGSWPAFADGLVAGPVISASGVARIWPEHLNGGGLSNPDHAFELHPLLTIDRQGAPSVDLSKNVFAGGYKGGVSNETALKILAGTSISVALDGGMADIQFRSAAAVGNFTLLDLSIDRSSIASDGAGSFRMNGEVLVDGNTSVPVRIVTARGTAINDAMASIKAGRGPRASIQDALVLFSVSPESLLRALKQSTAASNEVDLERPIQLILFGTKDDE